MRRGLGREDILHKQFANAIRSLENVKVSKIKFWTYFPSGEKRTASTGSLLKSKGLKTGVADYLFITEDNKGIDHFLWLEMKAPEREKASFDMNKGKMVVKKICAGRQSEEQNAFQELFSSSKNSLYALAYSVDGALRILEDRKFINLN